MPTRKEADDFISHIEGNLTINRDILTEALEWISNHLDPENVFSNEKLEKWAEENGYAVKEQ